MGKEFVADSANSQIGNGSPETSVHPLRRLPISYRGISTAATLIDLTTIACASLASQSIARYLVPAIQIDSSRDLAAGVFIAVLVIASLRFRDLYNPKQLLNWRLQFRSVASAWGGAFLILASGLFTSRTGDAVSRIDLVVFAALGGIFVLVHRVAWLMLLPSALREGGLRMRSAALLSFENVEVSGIGELLHAYGNTLTFSGVVPGSSGDEEFSREIEALVASVRGKDVGEIFVAADLRDVANLRIIQRKLRVLPQPVTLLPVGALRDLVKQNRVDMGSLVALEMQRAPLSAFELFSKRAVDIVLSFVGLVVLSPVLLLTALAIRLDSPGPILFRQTRHGFNGQAFAIFKFRTMRVLENGPVIRQATENDPRVTKVGKWLRRYSVDELPQLLNVLAGDMSIVGPRPHATAHDKHFSEMLEKYAFRHHVKAGLTGWAQINGARGETDTLDKMERRVDLDLWYINNWSLQLDIYIMLKTAAIVVAPENAH